MGSNICFTVIDNKGNHYPIYATIHNPIAEINTTDIDGKLERFIPDKVEHKIDNILEILKTKFC